MSKSKPAAYCPCGSGYAYADCCGPYLDGLRPAPSPEALMRSRYTAYARGNEAYILDTWHASTRPESVAMDPAVKWIRLKILDSGGDRVAFIATYRVQGRAQRMQENSRFVFEDGTWWYVDGVAGE